MMCRGFEWRTLTFPPTFSASKAAEVLPLRASRPHKQQLQMLVGSLRDQQWVLVSQHHQRRMQPAQQRTVQLNSWREALTLRPRMCL